MAACLAVTLPAYASAGAGYYCNQYIGADTWCGSGAWLTVSYNQGFYAGTTPTVRVGIRQTLPGGTIINRKFADMIVSSNSANRYSYAAAANASSNPHTIGGYMTWVGTRLKPAAKASARTQRPTRAIAAGYSATARSVGRADYAGGISDKGYPCIKKSAPGDSTESCNPNTSKSEIEVVVTEDKTADLPDGMARVFGRAAAGVKSVRVSLEGSKSANVPVVNGVFVAEMLGDASAEPSVRVVR